MRRENRFRVAVEIGGEVVAAHLPNSGRLAELLTPARPCWLAAFDSPQRKTRFDLTLVACAGVLVSVDACCPNGLLHEALEAGRLPHFAAYPAARREVRHGSSRLDFRLTGEAGTCWVEAKSVTLVEDGIARFPDAPTLRGVRHVRELMTLVEGGGTAAITFVVQRADARLFVPHFEADRELACALREAERAGVGIHAWSCGVSRREIILDREIPVDLG